MLAEVTEDPGQWSALVSQRINRESPGLIPISSLPVLQNLRVPEPKGRSALTTQHSAGPGQILMRTRRH